MAEELIIKKIAEIIRVHVGDACKVFLFGSHARGNKTETSDIDIAIFHTAPLSRELYQKIIDEKDAIQTLRKIDIVDLQTMSPVFQNEILSYAQRI